MKHAPLTLLDASALLAVLGDEEGADLVMDRIDQKAVILSIQWAEVTFEYARAGGNPSDMEPRIREAGITADRLHVVSWSARMGTTYARIRAALEPHVRIGFADYAALAGALVLDVPLLTADSKVSWIDVGAKVVHFRPWERISRPANVPARISLR